MCCIFQALTLALHREAGNNDTQELKNGKSFMNLKWVFDKKQAKCECEYEAILLLPRVNCKHNIIRICHDYQTAFIRNLLLEERKYSKFE